MTVWYAGWAHIRPQRVEKRNKHTKKICAPSWIYLQDYTGMHRQQNITDLLCFVYLPKLCDSQKLGIN
jgi:hypothetical protein